jgi:hypothetical protein
LTFNHHAQPSIVCASGWQKATRRPGATLWPVWFGTVVAMPAPTNEPNGMSVVDPALVDDDSALFGSTSGRDADDSDFGDADDVFGGAGQRRVGRGRAAGERAGRRGAPLPVAALVAVLWAVALGLAPVLAIAVASVLGSGASLGGVIRAGAGAWLLGHFVPVGLAGTRITLIPLGVTAWIGWRLLRAGVHASRATGAHRMRSPWPAVRAGLAVGIAYAVAGVVAAAASGTAAVSGWRVFGTFAALGATLAVAGALGHARAGRRLMRRFPVPVVDAVRAGFAAVAFLLAAGGAAVGLALALHGGAAADTLGSYRAGVAGQLGITAGCLAYLPNFAVWAAAYLIGPGFAFGVGTVVSPADVLTGPVLAALPSAPLSGVGPALLGVPLAAGIAAGLLLARRASVVTDARRSGPSNGWLRLLIGALLAGPVAGVLVQLAVLASRGGLGPGRLAVIGVMDTRVPLIAAGVISLGTVLGAVSRTVLRRS